MHNTRRRGGRAARAGFTIVELLIVMGILAVLLSFLLPIANSARESARRIECLANIRTLATATTAYMTDNRGSLPEAGTGNVPIDAPFSPRFRAKAPWARISGARPRLYVLPSIGGLLRPYLAGHDLVWRCPSSPDRYDPPFTFTVLGTAHRDAFVLRGKDPYSGFASDDWFNPTYHYLADKEWFGIARSGTATAARYKLREWASRNVSGLRHANVTRQQGAASVVLFHDRFSTYHSEPKPGLDIYTNTGKARYFANFAFLDGHAESRAYPDVNGYLAVFHRPIRQSWWGYDFAKELPEQYQ